jgi:hypothetical protein
VGSEAAAVAGGGRSAAAAAAGSTAAPPSVSIGSSAASGAAPPEKIAVLRIRDVYIGSLIGIISIPDPGSTSKNLSILTQKIVSKLSEI